MPLGSSIMETRQVSFKTAEFSDPLSYERTILIKIVYMIGKGGHNELVICI